MYVCHTSLYIILASVHCTYMHVHSRHAVFTQLHMHTHIKHMQLCMPEGLIFKKNLENPRQTHFHSFLITRENGSQAYASVLTFYEEVEDAAMLSTLDALQRSFLLTRRVTLNSDFNETTFDPNTDKLYAPKCLCFMTCKPIVRPCRAYLEQLHAVTTGGKQATGGLPVESFVYNILYEVPLPMPGKTTKFTGKQCNVFVLVLMLVQYVYVHCTCVVHVCLTGVTRAFYCSHIL